MKPIIIKNTSVHADNAVRWLVNFAARYVRSEFERMGDLELFDKYGFYIQFQRKVHYAYSGRYFYQLVRSNGGNWPRNDEEKFRRVLVKVGNANKFPILNWTDHRYKDMPEGSLNDWEECAVAITAHELAHVKYSGGKNGETQCDTIMHDAVDAFRKVRADYNMAMEAGVIKEEAKMYRQAAKQAPEAVLAKKIAGTQKAIEKWNRKMKLATTKMKKYSRLLKRLERKQQTLNIVNKANT